MLAVLQEEPGAELVVPLLKDSIVSVVNLAEVYSRLIDSGLTGQEAHQAVALLSLTSVPMDEELALRVGELRPMTRSSGLSLGDRSCLALAAAKGGTAVTADRAWTQLEVCTILSIR